MATMVPPRALRTELREVRERAVGRPTRAQLDVRLQRTYDKRRRMTWHVYNARVEAVGQAKDALRAGVPGAKFALRQALVDLAACCEEMSVPMLAPDERIIATGD